MNKSRYLLAAVASAVGSATGAFAQDDAALLARGDYLMNGPVACGNCHTTRAEDGSLIPEMELAGGFRINEEPFFDVYAANITPDVETGIGTWTDEQIITAVREGKDAEGEVIFPPMAVPTYNNMSDEDVRAIVAYLRSVEPIFNEVPESTWNIPLQAMPPAKGDPAPPASDQVAYGDYIVNALAHCFECHTPLGPEGQPDMSRMGAGGFGFTLAPGAHAVSANITPDPETGIGNWTDEEIKKAMTEGVAPDGHQVSPPMPVPFFATMTDEDLDAVVAYLRTIPPVVNEVERTEFQKAQFR